MIIDIIFFIILVSAIRKGYAKGFVLAIFSFIAFFVGLAAAIKLSALMAKILEDQINVSARYMPVLAFIIVFLLVAFSVRLGAKMVEKVLEFSLLGWVNKLAGIIFFGLTFLIIYSIILFYARQADFLSAQSVSESRTYHYYSNWGPLVFDSVGEYIPFLKDMFEDLKDFFGKFADSEIKVAMSV